MTTDTCPEADDYVEFFRRSLEQQDDMPIGLPENVRASRSELSLLLEPFQEVHLRPDLRHHGAAYAAGSAILAAVLDRLAPFPKDTQASDMAIASAYLHDSQRTSDWELRRQVHARRAAKVLCERGAILLPHLDQTTIAAGTIAVNRHTLTTRQKIGRNHLCREVHERHTNGTLAEYLGQLSMAQRIECITQDIDALESNKYYSGGIVSWVLRHEDRFRRHTPIVKSRHQLIQQRLVLPQTSELLSYADALYGVATASMPLEDSLKLMLDTGERVGLVAAL